MCASPIILGHYVTHSFDMTGVLHLRELLGGGSCCHVGREVPPLLCGGRKVSWMRVVTVLTAIAGLFLHLLREYLYPLHDEFQSLAVLSR